MKELSCQKCGATFAWAKRGRSPKSCLACAESKNRSRALRTIASGASAAQAKATLAALGLGEPQSGSAADEASRALAPHRFAIASGMFPGDPLKAAAVAGIDPADIEHVAIAAADMVELREGRSSEVASAVNRAILLAAYRLLGENYRIPPAALPAMIKALGSVIDSLGFGTHAYSKVELRLVGPSDES